MVFTCLPSPRAVEAVLAGPNGILEGLAEGGIWIDNSTNDQHETMRLAELCAAKGVHVLESPVTGGVHKAAAGEITVLVGGDEAVFQENADLTWPLLVCTDSAARGLDIAAVGHVIQAEFALNVVQHVHRIGRASRAGRPVSQPL